MCSNARSILLVLLGLCASHSVRNCAPACSDRLNVTEITETLFALGLGDRVAVSLLTALSPPRRKAAEGQAAFSSLTPSSCRLRPDLVIVTRSGTDSIGGWVR